MSSLHGGFTVSANTPLDKDQALQKAIAYKLMALADSGVTDPQELRRRTLEDFDFKPPH